MAKKKKEKLELEIWAEKYRPKKFEEIINQEHVISRVKAFVEEKNIPHLLFAGPAGTGKTTTALVIARSLYGEHWRQNVLELNASDARGIDVIRGRVKDFARTKPIGDIPFKLIILDEADALTNEAQQALRRTMEDFSDITRFILICNYSSKIIDPIQSRCVVFRFKAMDEKHVRKFIERIVKNEKLKIDEKAIKAIVDIAEGDLRRTSNLLQAAAALTNKITEEIIYEVASLAKPSDVREMLNLAIKGKFDKAREKLIDMVVKQGLAGEDLIKQIYKEIYNLDLPDEAKIELIEKTGEYEYRISEGGDPQVQIAALLSQISLAAKKFKKA
ncbi:MAG: Replication factor C small subunit [Candidatus Aenigmarchaeota archaeon ex4484_224]|nr:MAG: Replication factor C small subunit [Candidatus Aenigmarchaeota archaeon ex4484_224]